MRWPEAHSAIDGHDDEVALRATFLGKTVDGEHTPRGRVDTDSDRAAGRSVRAGIVLVRPCGAVIAGAIELRGLRPSAGRIAIPDRVGISV